jgi:hypothetical protein
MHDDTAVDGLRIGCAFWQPILSRTRCIFDATITGIEIAPGTTDAFFKLPVGSSAFNPLVLLGMDEARELIDAEGSLFEQFRYSMLFWPLKTACDLKSFCVLIDTQSRLNNYQPNPIKNPSLRHVISSNLYEPIQIYGNWNISVPGEWWLNLDGSDKQALSVQFQQSTFKTGRPLWYSYYKNLEPLRCFQSDPRRNEAISNQLELLAGCRSCVICLLNEGKIYSFLFYILLMPAICLQIYHYHISLSNNYLTTCRY